MTAATLAPASSSVLRAPVSSTSASCAVVVTMRCWTELRRHRRIDLPELRDCRTDHSWLFGPPEGLQRPDVDATQVPERSARPSPLFQQDMRCARVPRFPIGALIFVVAPECMQRAESYLCHQDGAHGMGSSDVFFQCVVSFAKGVSFAGAIKQLWSI